MPLHIEYIRVSSFEQNIDRQLEGIVIDSIFTDKALGKSTKRPQLDAMLDFVREGALVRIGRDNLLTTDYSSQAH